MSSFLSNALGREARTRKQMRQIAAMYEEICSCSTLSRIDNNHQTPTQEMLEKLMRELGIPMDEFFSPHFINQSTETLVLRDKLLYCLNHREDAAAAEDAGNILGVLERVELFDKGINRQFLLSCKARIYEMENRAPGEVIALIYEGMALTYTDFNVNYFAGEMLIFEEIELLHTLALTYRRSGKLTEAVDLLERMVEGIELLPEDDKEKGDKLTKVLLTLSRFFIEQNEFEKALAACEHGYTSSSKYVGGKYTADFSFNKAVCLCKLNRPDESERFYKLAYFGYILLHEKAKAKRVKEFAEKNCGVVFNTYGAEDLNFNERTFIPYAYGKQPDNYKALGELIAALRVQANVTRKQLCTGICNESTLLRIERGGIGGKNKNGKQRARGIKQPSVYILEALMQRLGRDINRYFHTFLSAQSFYEKQIRNEIIALLTMRKHDEAEKLIRELEVSKDYMFGANLQFINIIKANILADKEGCGDKYLEQLNSALRITIPDFDMKMIESYRLTYNEIILINMMALTYAVNKEIPQAVKIIERLRDSVNKNYEDESEKIRAYLMILYNYSKYLGLLNRNEEALNIVSEGEALALKYHRLTVLPGLILNKAYILLGLGNLKEAVPYFAACYYGFDLIGDAVNKGITCEYVKNHINILLD